MMYADGGLAYGWLVVMAIIWIVVDVELRVKRWQNCVAKHLLHAPALFPICFFFGGGLVFIYPRTLAFSTFWTHVGSYNMLLGSHTCHRKCKSICFSSWYIFGKSMSFPDTVFC